MACNFYISVLFIGHTVTGGTVKRCDCSMKVITHELMSCVNDSSRKPCAACRDVSLFACPL